MTGKSAHHFGLRNRGILAVGKHADVCVFDAGTIRDSATFEQPTSPALGIRYVFVNGELALANGLPLGSRGGMVLLKN
jgi:N-acyl-D-amino-acid deacylase